MATLLDRTLLYCQGPCSHLPWLSHKLTEAMGHGGHPAVVTLRAVTTQAVTLRAVTLRAVTTQAITTQAVTLWAVTLWAAPCVL